MCGVRTQLYNQGRGRGVTRCELVDLNPSIAKESAERHVPTYDGRSDTEREETR